MRISKQLIDKYNIPVPRYTSYPPANHFKDDFSENEAVKLIEQSNQNGDKHIAIYIHIPFCSKICFYCGCNACSIKNEESIQKYFQSLHKELHKVFALLDKNRKVSQIHYGGGTPNSVDVKYIEELNNLIFKEFTLIENPEIAIECNPAYLNFDYADRLIQSGFNRFSLGIQDFNEQILKSVNRSPSAIPVGELVAYLKNKNPQIKVNLDFIYGLPGQNPENFSDTIQRAIAIKPDRLVTFSYAHVPWMKKHQQILEKKGLPDSDLKMEMFLTARELLLSSGYVPIGLDHYVLPDDELNIALSHNKLHRNFQGYCTKRTTGQVYAFGVSAISQLENAYIQNVKDVKTYIEKLNNNNLAVEKGIAISKNQMIIRDVITKLMCNQFLNISEICSDYQINLKDFEQITQFKQEKLQEFINDGLLQFENQEIKVSETGSLFIRNIAATMDPEYTQQNNKYSKTV